MNTKIATILAFITLGFAIDSSHAVVDGPITLISSSVGQIEVSKVHLDYCETGNDAEYLKARQLNRGIDENERANSCEGIARSVGNKGDYYLAFQYYKISCEVFNHADACEDIFELLDKITPEHREETKQFAISVCQRGKPIVGRTSDIRDDLCYKIGKKTGVSFPKSESDLKDYKIRISMFNRSCQLGNLGACNDLSFDCDTYKAGCSDYKCPDFRKSAQQIACSAAVPDAEAKRLARNKEQADDKREREKEARWQERVRAAEEEQRAAGEARNQSLADTLNTIRMLGNVASTAAQSRVQIAAAKQGYILPPAKTGDPIQDATAQTMQNIEVIRQNSAMKEQNKKIAAIQQQQQDEAASQAQSSAAMAGSGRTASNNSSARTASDNSSDSPTAAQLDQTCKNVCRQQLADCNKFGAQAACHGASACTLRCFANNAPNNPERNEWLRQAAKEDEIVKSYKYDGPMFSNVPSKQTYQEPPPPAYSPPPSRCTSGEFCAGAAR